MRTSFVLAVAMVAGMLIASTTAEGQQKGLDQLRGSWEVTKAEPGFQAKRLVFDGDKVTFVFAKTKKVGTITLDTAAKPARIDFVRDKEKIIGIYEVKGDTLRICLEPKGETRPTEFKAAEGVILVTLKREAK